MTDARPRRPPRESRLRILFTAPAYWPAIGYGGPIWMARELNAHANAQGHHVEVITTSMTCITDRGAWRTRVGLVDGVKVHYLAAPLHYRWTGLTPSLASWLWRMVRPDVAHIFGFRDPVGFGTARWCRRHGIPYVLEPLGMLLPKLRKIALKRLLDATLFRPVVRDAALIVATSNVERDEILATGVEPGRVAVRGNGFPEPQRRAREGWLRRLLDVPAAAPIVLYVGRIAAGKGIEHLLATARALPHVHLVLAGPDHGDGTLDLVRAAQADAVLARRVHLVAPRSQERPFDLYAEADVFVLPSAGESFGMVAAEAAACGIPTIVTDRCGVAEVFARGGAMVVPYAAGALRDAIGRVLCDEGLRQRLSDEALAVTADNSWSRIATKQEALYRSVTATA